MAHCNDYIDLISAGLDGALTPEEAARLDAHLAVCPECRKLKAELEQVHAALQSLPAAEPPAGLYDRIMEAVAADNVVPFAAPGKKKPVFHWRKWAAAAAMFAVILVGYGSMNRPHKEAPMALDTPQPSTETAGFIADSASNARSGDRSVEIQMETDTAAPFSGEQEPAEETAVAPRTVPDAPLESPPAPQPTAAPTFKAASSPARVEETPEAQPTAMVRSFVTAALPSEEAPVENETETGDSPDISLFVASNGLTGPETTPSPDPEGPAADGDNNAEEITEIAMTPREALDIVMEDCYMPEDAVLVETEDFLGWQTPYCEVGKPTGDPDAQQVSLQLQYLSLSANEKYQEFCLFDSFIDAPGEEERRSVKNYYAVPVDGGEILVERQEIEGDFQDEAAWEAYQAGIDAYFRATTE